MMMPGTHGTAINPLFFDGNGSPQVCESVCECVCECVYDCPQFPGRGRMGAILIPPCNAIQPDTSV